MERSDASSAVGGPDWIQTSVFPPELVSVDLRWRVAFGSNVCQYQIEVSNPVTKELLAMRSRPQHGVASHLEALEEAVAWLRGALEMLVNPDPF